MSYLHETRLLQAQKALRMLGFSNRKKSKIEEDADNAAGNAVGMIGGMAQDQKADLEARQKAAAALKRKEDDALLAARAETEDTSGMSDGDYKEFRDDVTRIKTGFEPTPGPEMPAQGINWGPQDAFAQAKQGLKLNAAAADAPIAGDFTRNGWEKHEKESDAEAHDINLAKGMLGSAAMMKTYPTYGGMLGSGALKGGY